MQQELTDTVIEIWMRFELQSVRPDSKVEDINQHTPLIASKFFCCEGKWKNTSLMMWELLPSLPARRMAAPCCATFKKHTI